MPVFISDDAYSQNFFIIDDGNALKDEQDVIFRNYRL